MPLFKVYYTDGSTFTGDAFETPALNVLFIVEKSAEHGRRLISNGDYYVYESHGWEAVDREGMFQYLCDKGPRRILLGRIVPNEQWNAIRAKAESDPDFPPRTSLNSFGQ
jgi:hypothetical protein